MQASITDDLELVLRWCDNGESTIRFALASSSEFTIACRVWWEHGLNYQGETTVSFQTMCYGHDLKGFETELRRLGKGESDCARFINTGGDFEIRIARHECKGRRMLLSELRYRPYRDVDETLCLSELILPIGTALEVAETARSVGEFIRLLKVDCRYLHELPNDPA